MNTVELCPLNGDSTLNTNEDVFGSKSAESPGNNGVERRDGLWMVETESNSTSSRQLILNHRHATEKPESMREEDSERRLLNKYGVKYNFINQSSLRMFFSLS
jgi:hypothetical protein